MNVTYQQNCKNNNTTQHINIRKRSKMAVISTFCSENSCASLQHVTRPVIVEGTRPYSLKKFVIKVLVLVFKCYAIYLRLTCTAL